METKNHDPRDPRVLLCVAGTSPAVVTETVYALAVKPPTGLNAFIPTEIWVITTRKGRDLILKHLLPPAGRKPSQEQVVNGQGGEFPRLLADYPAIKGLDACRFDSDSIVVVKDGGRFLDDIVTARDNDCAADCIMDVVRKLIERPNANHMAIHASLAGGRKSMGFYLGYCLSLFGRPQDRLSHVLVSDPYDDCDDFFYPTPKYRAVHTRQGDVKNAMKATVELAEVPVVLWSGLARGRVKLPEQHLSYTDIVRRFNSELSEPQLTIDFAPGGVKIKCGEFLFPLEDDALPFYVWLATRRHLGLPGVNHQEPLKRQELCEEFSKVALAVDCNASNLAKKYSDGLKSYFQQRKTNIEAIAELNAIPGIYLIQTVRMAPSARLAKTGPLPSRYALERVLPDQIHISGDPQRVRNLLDAIDVRHPE